MVCELPGSEPRSQHPKLWSSRRPALRRIRLLTSSKPLEAVATTLKCWDRTGSRCSIASWSLGRKQPWPGRPKRDSWQPGRPLLDFPGVLRERWPAAAPGRSPPCPGWSSRGEAGGLFRHLTPWREHSWTRQRWGRWWRWGCNPGRWSSLARSCSRQLPRNAKPAPAQITWPACLDLSTIHCHSFSPLSFSIIVESDLGERGPVSSPFCSPSPPTGLPAPPLQQQCNASDTLQLLKVFSKYLPLSCFSTVKYVPDQSHQTQSIGFSILAYWTGTLSSSLVYYKSKTLLKLIFGTL